MAALGFRCCTWAFSRRAGATLHCGAWASHCSGFSCCGAWALCAWASVVVARGLRSCGSRALEHRFSSCGTRAQLLCGMWNLPRPGIEPVPPAVEVWSLNHWTTRGVPYTFLINCKHQYLSPWILISVARVLISGVFSSKSQSQINTLLHISKRDEEF